MQGYTEGGKTLEKKTEFGENATEITFDLLDKRQKLVYWLIYDLKTHQDNERFLQTTIERFAKHANLGKKFAAHMTASIMDTIDTNEGEPLTRADIIHCMGSAAEHVRNRRISPRAIEEAAIFLEYEDGLEGGSNDLERTQLQAPMATIIDKISF